MSEPADGDESYGDKVVGHHLPMIFPASFDVEDVDLGGVECECDEVVGFDGTCDTCFRERRPEGFGVENRFLVDGRVDPLCGNGRIQV